MKPTTRKEKIKSAARVHRVETMARKIKGMTDNFDKLEKRLKALEDKK